MRRNLCIVGGERGAVSQYRVRQGIRPLEVCAPPFALAEGHAQGAPGDMAIWQRERQGANPIEPGPPRGTAGVQRRAFRYGQTLGDCNAVASVGSKGDSCDKAMAEALILITQDRTHPQQEAPASPSTTPGDRHRQ